MLKEFKAFIMTGNVIEFAVAVILASAIGLVINGFVNDIVMPIVGQFSGGMDFSNLAIELSPAQGVVGEAGYVPANAIRYGAWINSIVNLITVGLVLFMMIKAYNKVKKAEPEAPAAPAGPTQEELLAQIRDLLKK
ncbi:MAG: large conductance mechanosensitive channel protein MscL [Bacteroidetes bacterium]|nr:MAG: large conductance mechanosensitive channel protein MscL [Bacteroidota bacterium]PTM12903.1 MAG: large conductance mechanosensitive channel protein MscL [Bacteroidota bacterium]